MDEVSTGMTAPNQPTMSVCAVVVTHDPDAGLRERLNRVHGQCGAMIIVDNCSGGKNARRVRELAAMPGVELILNPENRGVARALNQGIEPAIARGYHHALMLDQDTVVEGGMVEHLLGVCVSHPDSEHLAAIGAGYRDPAGRPGAAADPVPAQSSGVRAAPWDEVGSVITSGCLLPLAAHRQIGPFREEFFIDHVDTDYCLRARAKGFRVVRTRRALMRHSIGTPTRHRILGWQKWTTNHAPDRRYYMARNDTVLLHEYGGYAAGMWALKGLARSARQCKRIALYEDAKALKMLAVMHGWLDALRGRMGRRFMSRRAATPPRTVPQNSRHSAYSGRRSGP